MSFKNAYAGMASYMEADVEINVDASEVAPEEAVAETSEIVAEEAEVADAAEEVVDAEEAAEMAFQMLDRQEMFLGVIDKHGFSRAVAELYLMDANPANLSSYGYQLNNAGQPQLESFSIAASSMSSQSIAAQEGIKDTIKAVWEWIKKQCIKIGNFIGKLFSAVMLRVRSLDSNIGKLRAALKKSSKDADKGKDKKAKIYTISELKDLGNKMDVINVSAIVNETKVEIERLTRSNTGLSSTKETVERDDFDDELKKIKELFKDPSEQKLLDMSDPAEYLNFAASIKQYLDKFEANQKVTKANNAIILEMAKREERRSGEDNKDESRKAKKAIKLANQSASLVAKVSQYQLKLANEAVRAASAILSNCYKKD